MSSVDKPRVLDSLAAVAFTGAILALAAAAFGPPPVTVQPGEWHSNVPRMASGRYECPTGILASYDNGGNHVTLHCLPLPREVPAHAQ